GRQILGSARVILRQLGKAEAGVITVDDAAAASKSFANTVFNGDGVIIPESADDTAVQQVIREAFADRVRRIGGWFRECAWHDPDMDGADET
ncbi:MAG: hypothetical protein AN487_24145, partial [Anabaena sp. CRKS33]